MHLLYNYKQAKYSANYIFVLKYVIPLFTKFAGLLVSTYMCTCIHVYIIYIHVPSSVGKSK